METLQDGQKSDSLLLSSRIAVEDDSTLAVRLRHPLCDKAVDNGIRSVPAPENLFRSLSRWSAFCDLMPEKLTGRDMRPSGNLAEQSAQCALPRTRCAVQQHRQGFGSTITGGNDGIQLRKNDPIRPMNGVRESGLREG